MHGTYLINIQVVVREFTTTKHTYTCMNSVPTNRHLQMFYNIRISYKACAFDFTYAHKAIDA